MHKLFISAAFAAIAAPALAGGHGGRLPGMRGPEHIGFTVPDLSETVSYLRDVPGCGEFYPLGPFYGGDSTRMTNHLNLDARATIPEMRLMRREGAAETVGSEIGPRSPLIRSVPVAAGSIRRATGHAHAR